MYFLFSVDHKVFKNNTYWLSKYQYFVQVCNNNGNCHCPAGFACPDCRYLGPGGSLDSGQGCVNQTTDKSCGMK